MKSKRKTKVLTARTKMQRQIILNLVPLSTAYSLTDNSFYFQNYLILWHKYNRLLETFLRNVGYISRFIGCTSQRSATGLWRPFECLIDAPFVLSTLKCMKKMSFTTLHNLQPEPLTKGKMDPCELCI